MGKVSVVGKTGEQNDGQQIKRKKEKKKENTKMHDMWPWM